MEGILGAAAVRGRVRQRPDGVEQLDHGAGPAVGHDQRQRVLVRRPDVDEVDVHAIDLADELRQRVQARLDPPEVVLVQPVTRERLQRLQLDTLRPVGDELLARPTCRADACAQVVELLFGNVDVEGADLGGCLCRGAHVDLLSSFADRSGERLQRVRTGCARCRPWSRGASAGP